MRYRKSARDTAFLVLYRWDLRGDKPSEIFKEVVEEKNIQNKNTYEYAKKLVETTVNNISEIDAIIEKHLKGWSIDRLGYVERNALRLGVAELLFLKSQEPGRVFIDIIDIVKKFTDEKAAKFVNGVLSAIYRSFLEKKKEKVKN
ncbi:transcription antitermination factor NusB [Aquifex pyrophilus]|uniref:Transcription antitermination protein NusB n=1 Tax=Aquifex pyrophilus TaxID=2714 RepID=Q8GLK4_AQUPY|nr:transcription termination factor [Aquifex pyrophilus]